MAYFETFVAPVTLEDMPERFHPMVKVLRSSAGEALVRDENMLIEKFLPSITQRALSADEMAEYRRPFLQAGDDRWLTLVWAREVPWSGEPADVHDRIAAYSAWLRTARRCRSSLSTWSPACSSHRVGSRTWRAASPTSTTSSSKVSTSCRRTGPTRSEGRSPAGSNGFDGPSLGRPSRLCVERRAAQSFRKSATHASNPLLEIFDLSFALTALQALQEIHRDHR
jgi:hypothetical protein